MDEPSRLHKQMLSIRQSYDDPHEDYIIDQDVSFNSPAYTIATEISILEHLIDSLQADKRCLTFLKKEALSQNDLSHFQITTLPKYFWRIISLMLLQPDIDQVEQHLRIVHTVLLTASQFGENDIANVTEIQARLTDLYRGKLISYLQQCDSQRNSERFFTNYTDRCLPIDWEHHKFIADKVQSSEIPQLVHKIALLIENDEVSEELYELMRLPYAYSHLYLECEPCEIIIPTRIIPIHVIRLLNEEAETRSTVSITYEDDDDDNQVKDYCLKEFQNVLSKHSPLVRKHLPMRVEPEWVQKGDSLMQPQELRDIKHIERLLSPPESSILLSTLRRRP